MKIGIDGFALTIPFPCGTKIYAQELLKALSRVDKKNEYVVFSTENIELPGLNFRRVNIPSILPILKRQLYLSKVVKDERLDRFHYLNPYGSIFLKHSGMICTVHDMQLSQTYPWVSQDFVKRLSCSITRFAVLKNSRGVIVPSESIKSEVMEYFHKFKYDLPIIKVIPHGLNAGYAERLSKYNNRLYQNEKPYILAMGDFAPRKNINRVLLAYKHLSNPVKSKYMLKIICSTQLSSVNILSQISNLSLENQAEVLVNISANRLADIYRKAEVFLYPSLYEGFGMPILEAMASSCPVITSKGGALEELAGECAVLVDPRETESIRQGIVKILTNDMLRKKLIFSGREHIKCYTWNKTARKVISLYNAI